jgi:hypothetical protein
MFGAITFLPVYLQIVKGVDPTVAGLRLLPLMAGLLTSISSGQLISRTGHYKIFPVIGTALMTIGLLLLSRLGPDSSARTSPRTSPSSADSSSPHSRPKKTNRDGAPRATRTPAQVRTIVTTPMQ